MDLFDCVRFTPYFKEVIAQFLSNDAVYYCICMAYASCNMLGVSSYIISVSSVAAVLCHTTKSELGSLDTVLQAMLVDPSDSAVLGCAEILYKKLKDINYFQTEVTQPGTQEEAKTGAKTGAKAMAEVGTQTN